MKIKKVDHLVLTVQDIDKTIAFYRDILNMEIRDVEGRIEARFGDQKINFHKEKGEFQPAAMHPTYGSQDLCFEILDEIEDIESELKNKSITIEIGIVTRTGFHGRMQSVYIRDPDGNLVELSKYE